MVSLGPPTFSALIGAGSYVIGLIAIYVYHSARNVFLVAVSLSKKNREPLLTWLLIFIQKQR
jgi:hypothetical protein